MRTMREIGGTSLARVATRPFVRVDVATPLEEVVRAMVAQRRGAVIVELDGRPMGIFTERDLLTRVDYRDQRWRSIPVGEVMTPRPVTMHADDTIADAISRLHDGRRRHLPVVDREGAVVDLVSIRDLLRHIAQRFPEDFMNLPPNPEHEASGEWGS